MDLKRLKEYIEVIAGFVGIFITISYALGFLVWNVYLQSLGFYPDNLLQGRFILTGILFIITIFSILGVFIIIKNFLEKIPNFSKIILFNLSSNKESFLRNLIISTLSILYLFTFSFFIFPHIDGYFGGAKPKLVSLVGDEQNIKYLNDFGIKIQKFQTGLLCSPYDDNNYIVIVLEDRILSFKKDIFKGFVSLPNKDYNKYAEECNVTVISNLIGWRTLILNK